MNYAERTAKQEITEARKSLRWLLAERGKTVATVGQVHRDAYLPEGPSTRKHIRSFVQHQNYANSSDTCSEFINYDLVAWCEARDIAMTWARPYKSNDNAHVEHD